MNIMKNKIDNLERKMEDLMKITSGLLMMSRRSVCDDNGPLHRQYKELQSAMEKDLNKLNE